MFERYTESARRVIFFARYEASIYGSSYIETEHLLLGLLRESSSLSNWFPNQPKAQAEIRAEIEKHIKRGKPIATSVEVPLTAESRKMLKLAAESAERLAHSQVEPVHLLIGMLRVEQSLAARILTARDLNAPKILDEVAKDRVSPEVTYAKGLPLTRLESFLAALKCSKAEELVLFFAEKAEFIDATGKRWKREEMSKGYEVLFAPYAKKNATYDLESTVVDTPAVFVANVLWKNALLASIQRAWMHRMSIVLVPGDEDWEIVLAQVTPVQLP
jgi:hypothetical protein